MGIALSDHDRQPVHGMDRVPELTWKCCWGSYHYTRSTTTPSAVLMLSRYALL